MIQLINADHLRKLRDVINVILADHPDPELKKQQTLHQKIKSEQQRHQNELHRIVREAREKQN